MPIGRITALLVEDNPDDADVLREILSEERPGVRLETAETLAEGLSRLAGEGFDLVLLDLSLPDSQGLATVERMLAATDRVPILVLTGLEDEALGAAAVQAGAQDYLVKGNADGAALVRSMRYAVDRHRLLSAQREDAQVWAALARAGEALLDAVAGRALVERLCTVAVSELGCDASSVWMLDRASASYVPAAAYPPMSWEAGEELRIPCARVEALVPDAGREEAVRWLERDQLPLLMIPGGENASQILLLGLSSGAELIGVQLCGYRESPPEPKLTVQIARGFVHAAALALSNARLVDELERSNSVKTYFAATMSHELRNTLFAIGGFGDMLVEAVGEDADAARLAQTIGARARDSLSMIQAALELTRSEVRPTGPDVGEVAVAELLQKIAAETHVPSEKPDLNVEWEVPGGLPAIRTDAVKLGMVLKNLVGNAIKFTERGTVRIAVEAFDGVLRFVVADSGVGIDASEVPHLFEPFRQAHGARSRRAGGAGLGLYIVSRLVELLGGAVKVESRAGGGTTFAVTVPLAPPTPA